MVASCGLDKFLRIHHLHSRKLLHKVLLKLYIENPSYEAVMRRPRIGNNFDKKKSCHLPQLSLPRWMKLVVESSSKTAETQEQNLPKRCCWNGLQIPYSISHDSFFKLLKVKLSWNDSPLGIITISGMRQTRWPFTSVADVLTSGQGRKKSSQWSRTVCNIQRFRMEHLFRLFHSNLSLLIYNSRCIWSLH